MPADYTLSVVYPDGNPVDVESFGTDLPRALTALRIKRTLSRTRQEHWMVWDADDPERGYFDDGL